MDLPILLSTAFTIGLVHTIIGPDHYLPFILIGRARKWSVNRTVWLTIFCGMGHVLSSVVLGLIGVALGIAVGLLDKVETMRGSIASWLLIGFGLAYMIWGIKVSIRTKEHSHEHSHDGVPHEHTHHHLGSHYHAHGATESTTPWALFIIFVLGPCEPLIPILMYPAAQHNWGVLLWVTVVFGITTITAMTIIVGLVFKGLLMINLGRAERYVHALAGLVIALSGLSLKLFGL